MAIDHINFTMSVRGQQFQAGKESQRILINKKKTFIEQGKIGLEINEKQKKHAKRRR